MVMGHTNWNEKLEYLQTTRQNMWNDDYFEFLVKNVWKLDKPINIIDFGCGYGYLGTKLLPLVSSGSTYTGIDIAETLIEKAKNLFLDAPYQTKFKVADLLTYETEEKYDVAICQSVLRHIPEVEQILQKMVKSVGKGGMVICIEPNRRMENSGIYVDDVNYDVFSRDDFLRVHWTKEKANGGRDFLVGMKIPVYMEQMGLSDVGIRVNDYVDFVSPKSNKESYEEHRNNFIANNLFDYQGENAKNFICAKCHLISYGTKRW